MRGLPLGSRTTSVDVETSWASGPRASAGASGRRGTFRREISVPERELHKGTRKHQIVCSSGSWAVAETEWQAVFCNPPCCLFPSLFKARGVPRPSEFRASALLPLQWGQLSASAVRHSGIVLMMLTTLVGRHSGVQRLRGPPACCYWTQPMKSICCRQLFLSTPIWEFTDHPSPPSWGSKAAQAQGRCVGPPRFLPFAVHSLQSSSLPHSLSAG